MHAYTWLKPDHDMLAISSSTCLALDSNIYQIAGDLALLTAVRTYFCWYMEVSITVKVQSGINLQV